jgi:peptidoglycan/xylan/chitin deacetylase (PgdA/CDA1 family)
VAGATGHAPEAYRPPYGIFSPAGLRYARARGWRPLLWSRWGRDWAARATPESIAAKVTDDLRAGDVLLLHDADWYSAPGSHRNTAAALPHVLDAIEARGLRTVRV